MSECDVCGGKKVIDTFKGSSIVEMACPKCTGAVADGLGELTQADKEYLWSVFKSTGDLEIYIQKINGIINAHVKQAVAAKCESILKAFPSADKINDMIFQENHGIDILAVFEKAVKGGGK